MNDLKLVWKTLCVCALLVGCGTSEERASRQAAKDAATCRGYGFEPGTTEFSECLQRIDQQRQQIASDYFNNVVNPYAQGQFDSMGTD